MRSTTILIAAGFLAILTAQPVCAQSTPTTGTWAVGGSIGIGVPSDASLDKGLDLAGSFEGYLTPRVSVRGQLGGSWWSITGRGFTGTVTPVRLDGNVIYNFDYGDWHPYVTAGIGMYRYRSSINSAANGTDTHAGGDFGGGIEYFFERETTLTGEVLYHRIDTFNVPVATFNDGSYWTFDIGLKLYLR